MKKYTTYKPSGFEWIGDIPEHWEMISIKHLVSTKITDGPHETPTFLDDGIPFLSVESVQNNKLDFNKKRGYISKELHDLYSQKCKPQKDDVFIVKSGSTTGKSTIVETDEDFNIWSPLCIVRSNKNKIIPRFTFSSIQSYYFRRFIELGWSFGTQPNIGMGVIENIKLVVPTISEQHQIVQFLDEKTEIIDKLISTKESKIDLLKEQRTSLINQVITKGLDPNVKMKDSGVEWIGEIPEHCEVKPLKYLVNIQGRIGYKGYTKEDFVDEGEGCLVLGGKHVDNKHKINLSSPEYISWEKYYESPEIMVKKGDLIISQRGTLGKCLYIDKDYGEMTINPSLVLVNQIKENPIYLWYNLQCDYLLSNIQIIGSTTTIPMLSQVEISSFKMIIPTIIEQELIVKYLDEQTKEIDDLILLEQKKIDLLKEYRQTLISEVITGKIDVRTNVN